MFKISHYLCRCSALCPCSSRSGFFFFFFKRWLCPSETLLFFKGIQNCFLDPKQPNLWHRRSFLTDSSVLASLSVVLAWPPAVSLCGPGEGTVQGPYRPLRGSKVKNSKKRGSKKCWLGLMSCVDRGWLPGLCGWPLGWGPGQGDRACSPWCRLLRACHHPVPPFGRVSRLQAEDKLAFCFPWVYFNCIAATPDNGHILSPGNCPPPTGSCVPEKQDHHFQTWFFSSSFF